MDENNVNYLTEKAYKEGYEAAVRESGYMLISVIEGEIFAETFPSYESARAAMLNELVGAGGHNIKVPFNVNIEEYEDDDKFGYTRYGAYLSSLFSENRAWYEWRIVSTIQPKEVTG